MDVSVSLWCEEVEDEQGQDQTQDQTQLQLQSQDQTQLQSQSPGSSQLRAVWDPTVSGHRVIQRLLHVEERYMPSMLYVALIQRDPERREELAKWAMEVIIQTDVHLSVSLSVSHSGPLAQSKVVKVSLGLEAVKCFLLVFLSS